MTSVYTAYDPNTGLVALTGEDPGGSMATAPRRDPERYLDYRILHDADSYPSARQLVRSVTLAGEPSSFGLIPENVASYVVSFSLNLAEDVSLFQLADQYFVRRQLKLSAHRFYHVASARISS